MKQINNEKDIVKNEPVNLASDLIKMLSKTNRLLFKIIIGLVISWFFTIVIFIYYLNTFKYEYIINMNNKENENIYSCYYFK